MDKEIALKILRELHDKALFSERTALETFIPELKESEDERIRKELIHLFQSDTPQQFGEFTNEQFIAWLEKQKMTDEEIIFRPVVGTDIRIAAKQALEKIDIGKKVVLAFNGAYIPVNGKTVGEIDSEYDAWLEKQSEKLPAGFYYVNSDGKKFYSDTFKYKDVTLHVEKQDEQKAINDTDEDMVEPKFKVGDTIIKKHNSDINKFGQFTITDITGGKYWYNDRIICDISEQYEWELVEQKPTNEIEPKFKIGDFIVNDYCFGKVIEITNDAYLLDTGQGIPFSCEHNAHLWTIQDAKDGDVLVYGADEKPFIFKDLLDPNHPNCPVAYCGIDMEGYFYVSSGNRWTDDKDNIHPATKEQCDLLFQKMKEDGYEWDNMNKELNKIEQKITDKVGPKFKIGDWIACEELNTAKIVNINIDRYEVKFIDGNKSFPHIDYIDRNFHLWTIQDAKDGDVLQLGEVTAIFKEYIGNENCRCYCSVCNEEFEISVENGEDNIYGCTNTTPATKKQRDLLFQKMKEEGYVWNTEKKELSLVKLKAGQVLKHDNLSVLCLGGRNAVKCNGESFVIQYPDEWIEVYGEEYDKFFTQLQSSGYYYDFLHNQVKENCSTLWVARDFDGALAVFTNKPVLTKSKNRWVDLTDKNDFFNVLPEYYYPKVTFENSPLQLFHL